MGVRPEDKRPLSAAVNVLHRFCSCDVIFLGGWAQGSTVCSLGTIYIASNIVCSSSSSLVTLYNAKEQILDIQLYHSKRSTEDYSEELNKKKIRVSPVQGANVAIHSTCTHREHCPVGHATTTTRAMEVAVPITLASCQSCNVHNVKVGRISRLAANQLE